MKVGDVVSYSTWGGRWTVNRVLSDGVPGSPRVLELVRDNGRVVTYCIEDDAHYSCGSVEEVRVVITPEWVRFYVNDESNHQLIGREHHDGERVLDRGSMDESFKALYEEVLQVGHKMAATQA